MASSGTITLTLKSVDYYGCPAVCYPSTTGRGAITYTPSFTWNVDNSGHFTLSFNGETTGWYVCASSDNFYLKVQYSTDGSNWYDIGVASLYHPTCTSTYKVNQMLADLTNMLPAMTLTQSGYARIYTYTGNACPRQCPDDDHPNAYPTEAASQVVAVPVHIEVSYRPGERKVSGTWRSHNRSGGACERKVSGTWTEMRTSNGGTGTGDPPSRKTSGTWYNQRKIGAE